MIQREADEAGIHETTLRRAKKSLGIKSHKDGDKWGWRLPAALTNKPSTSVNEAA